MIEMPYIDLQKCNGCGICVSVCNCHAIIMKKGKAFIVETDGCGWCALCEIVCPEGAIICPFDIVVEG